MSTAKVHTPIAPERVQFVRDAVRATRPPKMLDGDDGSAGTADALQVTVLSGGITNELYRCRNATTGVSVVVRVYGKETERLISRSAEQFFQGKFLKTFGRHGDALVYEFLDGFRALEPSELPQHADQIARTLARFQCKATAASVGKEPYCSEELHSVNITRQWLLEACDAVTKTPKLAPMAADLDELTIACRWMGTLLSKARGLVTTFVCHNDLLSGNIMVGGSSTAGSTAGSTSSGASAELRFIDFEYCRKDFALFDVANHWNEWAGYDNDFTQYPTETQQARFLSVYYAELAELTGADAKERHAMTNSDAIGRAMVIANFLSLASNLTWAVWSLVQHAYSDIEFDYVKYYKLKFRRFKQTAHKFMHPFVALVLMEEPTVYNLKFSKPEMDQSAKLVASPDAANKTKK